MALRVTVASADRASPPSPFVHGIKGEVRLKLFSDSADSRWGPATLSSTSAAPSGESGLSAPTTRAPSPASKASDDRTAAEGACAARWSRSTVPRCRPSHKANITTPTSSACPASIAPAARSAASPRSRTSAPVNPAPGRGSERPPPRPDPVQPRRRRPRRRPHRPRPRIPCLIALAQAPQPIAIVLARGRQPPSIRAERDVRRVIRMRQRRDHPEILGPPQVNPGAASPPPPVSWCHACAEAASRPPAACQPAAVGAEGELVDVVAVLDCAQRRAIGHAPQPRMVELSPPVASRPSIGAEGQPDDRFACVPSGS